MLLLKRIMFFAVFFLIANTYTYASHYGMAGCGVGSLVFKDQPGKIQIVAATLNNFISPQTSAITSGTSGCYEYADSSSAHLMYIETNKFALKDDVVRGSGETLDGLIVLLGCEQLQTVKSTFKNNYKQFFSKDGASQILNAIKNDTNLKKYCSHLS